MYKVFRAWGYRVYGACEFVSLSARKLFTGILYKASGL